MIGIDKAPPRLYHRTLKDVAFNILQDGMIAGYGDSGKLHNYFAEETLDELGTRAEVRADHPVEIVLDASIVASECWLFKTWSEGICTRDKVPGSAIPYIRDTRSDEMVYSASADALQDEAAQDEEDDEEMERPAHAEVSPQASSPSAAAAASTDQIVVSPASTLPRLREVPDVLKTRTGPDMPAVLPTHHFGAVYLPTLATKGSASASHTTGARRNLASAGHQFVGNIATFTGKAVADLTESDLRGVHGHDVMKRGIISRDANAIAQARKAIKRAASDGHDSVYTRFTWDRTCARSMIEAGYNQRTMR